MNRQKSKWIGIAVIIVIVAGITSLRLYRKHLRQENLAPKEYKYNVYPGKTPQQIRDSLQQSEQKAKRDSMLRKQREQMQQQRQQLQERLKELSKETRKD